MSCTYEFFQDLEFMSKSLYAVRTPPISEDEIEEWRGAYEKMKSYDFEKIKSKYQLRIIRDECYEPPYQEYDTFGWGNYSA